MDYTSLADVAAFIYLNPRTDHTPLANLDTVAHIGLRINHNPPAEFHTLSDICECADITFLRHLYALRNIAGLLNSDGFRFLSLEC